MPLNILIAEDEKDIAEQYKIGFEDRGHKVKIVYNGVDEGIDEYRRAHQSLGTNNPLIYDAIIIDHNMPFFNGADLAEEIRSINPEQIIVFATSYGNQLIMGLDNFENVDLVAKPLSIVKLVKLVEDRFYERVLTCN